MAGNGNNPSNTTSASASPFDFRPATAGDQISDDRMGEIASRLIDLSITGLSTEAVRSVNPPADTSKLWIPIDEAGNVVGATRRYDTVSGTWVTDIPDQGTLCAAAVDPGDQQMFQVVDGCGSVPLSSFPSLQAQIKQIEILDTSVSPIEVTWDTSFSDTNYFISMAPRSQPFGEVWISDKQPDKVEVSHSGLSGGQSISVEIGAIGDPAS